MAIARTTDAEIIEALKLVKQHGSKNKAAHAAGVHPDVITKRLRFAKERKLTADSVIENEADKLKLENSRLKRALAEKKTAEDTAASIRERIYEIAAYDPAPPKWLVSHRKNGGTAGAPMTNWSDWHYGEVVSKAETAGLNEFNSDIAAERIQKLPSRIIRLAKGFAFKEHGKALDFPGIVVGLGGDMISGFIHEELNITNDRTPNQAIDELTDLIAAALAQLADEFGYVYVPAVVGNHGRTTHKPRAKQRVITSFEWNLYCALRRFFRDDDRIQFSISENTDVQFECMGHRFLWTHGDSLGVKGGDGIIGSIGPIMRGNIKIGRAEAQIGQDFDTLVIGHYHSYQPRGALFPAIVNGSLKGYDEYARLFLRAPYDRPTQALWLVHPDHGITAQMPIYLDEPKKTRKQPPFIMAR